MVETKLTDREYFLRVYGNALREWAKDFQNAYDLIVAISRKGPRLVELAVSEGLLPESILDKVVSERAIPFIGEKFDRVLVVDDSVTHGSRLQAVNALVQARLIRNADSVVHSLPLAVGPEARLEYLSVIPRIHLPLLAGELRTFIANESRALGELGLPLDIDYPILLLDGDFADLRACDDALASLAQSLRARLVSLRPVRHPSAPMAGGAAWTLLWSCEGAYGWDGSQKLRVCLDVQRTRMSLCLMAPAVWAQSDLDGLSRMLPAELASVWDEVTHASMQEYPVPGVAESLVVSANYLASCVLISAIHTHIAQAFSALSIHGRCKPRTLDVQLLLGRDLGARAEATVAAYIKEPRVGAPPKFGRSQPLEYSAVIPEKYSEKYHNYLDTYLETATTVGDVLHGLFYAQHNAIEIGSRGASDPHRRLQFGVSFGYMHHLVEQRLGPIPEYMVHASLDRLIDRACVVPRFIQLEAQDGQPGHWVRLFRVGEGGPIQWVHGLIAALEVLSDVLQVKACPAVCFEKYLVLAVCDDSPLEDQRLHPLRRDFAAKRSFDLYGARAAVEVDGGIVPLRTWGENQRILGQEADGQLTRIAVDLRASDGFPREESPYSAEVRGALEDLACLVRAITAKSGPGNSALVWITSLSTEGDRVRAYCGELSVWLHHKDYSVISAIAEVGSLIGPLGQRLPPAQVDDLKRIARHLRWLANAIRQAKLKKDLAKREQELIERIEAAVKASKDRNARRVWEAIRLGIRRQKQGEASGPGDSHIRSALNLADSVTDTLMEMLGLLGEQSMAQKGVVQRLRQALENIQNPKRLHAATVHTLEDILGEPVVPFLSELVANFDREGERCQRKLMRFLRAAVSTCERVNRMHTVSETERWEELETKRFVVVWDVVDSSVSGTSSSELQKAMDRANARLEKVLGASLLGFDPMKQPDENKAIVDSFAKVLEIYNDVREAMGTYVVRMGCEVNVDANIRRSASQGRYAGSAFVLATRMMELFDEILPEAAGSQIVRPNVSYLVVGEFAARWARQRGELPQCFDDTQLVEEVAYVPRGREFLRQVVRVYAPLETKTEIENPTLD